MSLEIILFFISTEVARGSRLTKNTLLTFECDNMLALWVLSALFLALPMAEPSPDPIDPFVVYMRPEVVNADTWKKLLKNWDDSLLKQIDKKPVKVWEELGCETLHRLLDDDWIANKTKTGYSYVEMKCSLFPVFNCVVANSASTLSYVSDKMIGPVDLGCSDFEEWRRCDESFECYETQFVCG